MATISSPGLGSGLDVNGIVSQLVALERRPIELLQKQQATVQSKLSAFGLLQSYTANVRDAVGVLAKADLWTQTKSSSSDSNAVAVTSTASAAKGSYSVEVSQLAQAQGLASGAYTSSASAVGTGTLHIELGTWTDDDNDPQTPPSFSAKNGTSAVDITIGPGADSLSAVRDAINAANAGVSASIVNDASGSRLVLRSTNTGEENAVRLTATADAPAAPGDPTLDALVYDPPSGTGTMSETMVARNAQATINGLSVSSASNTLSGVIDGMTLTLAATTSAPVNVNVGLDTGAMRTAVDNLVKAYNDINKYLADQTKYDPDTKTAGALQGDGSARSLQSQLRAMLRMNGSASGNFSRLSDLGLEVQRDGSLKVNDSKFNAALTDPAAVQAAFSADADGDANDGFAVRIKALTSALTNSDGLLASHTASLQASIARSDKQIAIYETRVAQTQDRLMKQYSSLDTSLTQLTNLNTYITQQITNWNKTGNN